MNKAVLGGEPELIALQRALGLPIEILDSDATGIEKSQTITRFEEKDNLNQMAEGAISILRRGAHYDMAIKKSSSKTTAPLPSLSFWPFGIGNFLNPFSYFLREAD